MSSPEETPIKSEKQPEETPSAPGSPQPPSDNEGDSDFDMSKLRKHKKKAAPKKPREARRKRASKPVEDIPAPNLDDPNLNEADDEDPQLRERRLLEEKLDAALKPQRKRKLAGDDLESMQDDAIAQLRDKMRNAALLDVEAIKEGKPAVNKMKMLKEVSSVLLQKNLADSILDGNLLESVRMWLEPLPDTSLPSFEIQKVMFNALNSLPIKTIHLRESGLGRVLVFYQKSKRPHSSIKRLTQKLINDWTRPIIGRSDNYRDKQIQQVDYDAQDMRIPKKRGPKTAYEESAERRNRAAIPSASGVSYTVAPRSNI